MENVKIKKHPLFGLLISQFFGAFNDNAWKLILFTLATRPLVMGETFELGSQMIATLAMLLFLVPMVLCSFPAGSLADRFSKRNVMIWTKALEVLLMSLATLSLYMAPTHLILPFILLALMGAQSALFGPAKYGILPEILPEVSLSQGNGLLEMYSMLAIIAGTGLGPLLAGYEKIYFAPLFLTGLALLGFIASWQIPKVPPARSENIGLVNTVKEAWSLIRADRILSLAILGSMFYWAVTSLLGQNILVYAKGLVLDLEKGELLQGIPPAAYGIGIALGALGAGRISQGRIELGLIPLGALIFSFSSLLLGTLQPELNGSVVTLLLMGFGSGLLIVPLNSLVQSRAPKEERGSIIAFNNILSLGGMAIGSLVAGALAYLGTPLSTMLLISSFLVICATGWAVRLLPEALIRLSFILLTLTVYRIRIKGAENIPAKGAALLAANHMSIIDALFILAVARRPVRFIMKAEHFNIWWVKPFAKLVHCIPVSRSGGARLLLESLRKAGEHLEGNELVCIFPEGQISRTGMLQPFHRGIEVMMKGHSCPIIPIHLDHVWGSIFSYAGEKFFSGLPQKIPYPIRVSVGTPLPADTPVGKLREAIQDLGCDAWIDRKADRLPIHHFFIRHVRREPWRTALADGEKKISRVELMAGGIALARILREEWDTQINVGIMVPPSLGGTLVNLAATLGGHPVVNLNYTAGRINIASAINQAELNSVVTSRAFVDKFPVEFPEGIKIIFLEDYRPKIGLKQRLIGVALALFAPIHTIEKYCGSRRRPTPNDLLTIIFTSGSTAEPKGVMLSHFNVDSNIQGVTQVIPLKSKKDKVMGILPLFHSFGYMTLWLGLCDGLATVTYPNPLDGKAIGSLVQKYAATVMMSTPSFLKIYMSRVLPEQFGSLRCLITGAEKLSPQLADAFAARFGIHPVEGYGTTECSPVISTSTLDVREPGIFQVGGANGSVGQAIPGVMVKIVDPETFEEFPPNFPGMLIVRGPNVMQGYLNRPDLTSQAIRNGWYVTGDIACIDQDGFIRITDRLSRFSKIGGEMIPHGQIEEAIHKVAQVDIPTFIVTTLPDEKRGEKLAVLHTPITTTVSEITKRLSEQGLPNLFIPHQSCFIQVEELPVLGSGKTDLKKAKEIAIEHLIPVSSDSVSG